MTDIISVLDKIISGSEYILWELNAEDPAFEKITFELEKRGKEIETLGVLRIEEHQKNNREIEGRLKTFEKLHAAIQEKTQNMQEAQKEKVGHAANHRKVEDKYKMSYNRY